MATVNLLALLGTTPAVVTETVYALLREDPGLEIREVSLIGTRLSATSDGGPSPLEVARARVLELADSIAVPRATRAALENLKFSAIAKGRHQLVDIRDTLEAEVAMEFIFDQVRRLTLGDMPPLVVSVAGGRKTMSAAAVVALQLLGRSGDRLVHVLVSDPAAEIAAHDFIYPRQHTSCPAGLAALNHEKVEVTLSDLCFVPVRALLPASVLELASFSKAREYAEEALRWSREPPPVELLANEHALVFANRYRVTLSPTRFVFMWEYACRKAEATCDCSAEAAGCPECALPDDHFSRCAEQLQARVSSYEERDSERVFEQLANEAQRAEALSGVVSNALKDIRARLHGTPLAEHAQLFKVKKPRTSRYRVLAYPGPIKCTGFSGF